jgi:hypothetical protein
MAYQASASANLFSDPGFENGGSAIVIKDGPWTWSGGSNGEAFYDSEVALSGLKSAKVVMWGQTANDYAYFVEEFEGIDFTTPYVVSAKFLNNSARLLNSDGAATIQVKWFNSLGTQITMDESAAFDNTYSLDQWHNISIESMAPAMAAKAAVVLVAKSNSAYLGESTVYVDEMSMEAVPEPASILMLASGLLGIFGFSRKR